MPLTPEQYEILYGDSPVEVPGVIDLTESDGTHPAGVEVAEEMGADGNANSEPRRWLFRFVKDTKTVVAMIGLAVSSSLLGGIGDNFGVRWFASMWVLLLAVTPWVFLRVAHGRRGLLGEATNDGVVWIAPALVFSVGSTFLGFVEDLAFVTLLLIVFAAVNNQFERSLRIEWSKGAGANEEFPYGRIEFVNPMPDALRGPRTLITPRLPFSTAEVDLSRRRVSHTSHLIKGWFAASTGLSFMVREDTSLFWLWWSAVLAWLPALAGALFLVHQGNTRQRWQPEHDERNLLIGMYVALNFVHIGVMALAVVGVDVLLSRD